MKPRAPNDRSRLWQGFDLAQWREAMTDRLLAEHRRQEEAIRMQEVRQFFPTEEELRAMAEQLVERMVREAHEQP